MRITDALLGEHGIICRLLDHVDRRVSSWSLDQAREAGAALGAVLRPHAAIEEELLFEPLEHALGHEPMPLAVLRLEHEEIEALLIRVTGARSLVESPFDRLVSLVRDHFAKEEGLLFPLALRHLDGASLNRLGGLWAAARGIEIGG